MWFSLQAPHGDVSNEYPQHTFSWSNKKKYLFVDFLFYSCMFTLFQFFLSLYGHKLPVLCLDISSDSKLLVSGSADRNVKIWGLDFGDCHKSIFAHDDR